MWTCYIKLPNRTRNQQNRLGLKIDFLSEPNENTGTAYAEVY